MSPFYFNLTGGQDLAAFFSRAPEQVKTQLALGLKLLSKLTDEQIAKLLEIVNDSLVSTATVSESDISSRFGLSSEEALALLSTANIIAVTLSTREDTAEQYLSAITKVGLITETDAKGPSRFIRAAIEHRASFKEALERSSLSSEALPVMTEFDTTVDIRPSFEKESNRITFTVPVLLVHIDTDKYGEEICFQLNTRQLEKMIESLKTALLQIAEAERWANRGTA